jgi:hypothetical protein
MCGKLKIYSLKALQGSKMRCWKETTGLGQNCTSYLSLMLWQFMRLWWLGYLQDGSVLIDWLSLDKARTGNFRDCVIYTSQLDSRVDNWNAHASVLLLCGWRRPLCGIMYWAYWSRMCILAKLMQLIHEANDMTLTFWNCDNGRTSWGCWWVVVTVAIAIKVVTDGLPVTD